MTDHLVRLLALAHGPQTASELSDSLRRAGVRAEEYQVTALLRRLQGEGVVRMEGTRWRLVHMPPSVTPKPPAQPAARRGIGAPAPVPANAIRVDAVSVVSAPPPSGRWEIFRRLCRYYMGCLLQDEAPQLRAYVNNQDDTWIALHHVPWARLAAEGDFAVSLAREQAPFQRNRVRRGDEECVYVGYPVMLVKPKATSRFIVPLFAQPLQGDWSGGVLHLGPDGPIAVNGAWLEYHFRQRVEREAFLKAIGFLSEVEEDAEETEQLPRAAKDFGQLAQDAAHYVHDPKWFAEHVNPLTLSQVPNWDTAEPGLYNVAVLTLGPRLRYTRSLLRDLRDISANFTDEDLDHTALAQIFPHDPPPPPAVAPHAPSARSRISDSEEAAKAAKPLGESPGDEQAGHAEEAPGSRLRFTSSDLVQTRLLHPAQRAAIVNALTTPASLVTGPPGTGKSEVVAAMLLNQLLRGCPSLFASKNHQALEAVLPRLNSTDGGCDLIVQASSRDLAQRQNYLAKLQGLLARPPRPDAQRGEAFRQRFSELFSAQRTAITEIQSLQQAREEYEKLTQQLSERRQQLPVAAQSDHALAAWPLSLTPERLGELESALRKVLRTPSSLPGRLWHWMRRRQIELQRQKACEPLRSLPNPFADRALPDPTPPAEAWTDFFTTWRITAEAAGLTSQIKTCEERIAQLPKAEDCTHRLAHAQEGIEKLTREWMAWAAGGLPNPLAPTDREALANLRAGIQTWGASRFSRELREHFPLILRAFPLWSVSNLSARSALALVPGLFDLVVVDEASQCDIPSVVPLLARSRRAVFVGDPMQLRHVSTLDAVVEQSLLQEYNLTAAEVQRFTYRANSAFDLAEANAQVPDSARVRLDLHFRSHDLIADYCNEAFYAKTLHVVTVTERLNIPRGVQPGIHWTHVAGRLEPGPTGAWCAEEVEIIASELLKLAAGDFRGTVGVVTPFRHQMIRLKDALETGDRLPRDFKERVHFLASTAHGFQGDERDLILFSLCAGPDMPDGATLFLRESPNLFNVAVSRARAVLHIVGNRDWALTCRVPFIEKLARRTLPAVPDRSPAPRKPDQWPWEKVLGDALAEANVEVVPQYPVAGRFLDLAVLAPRKVDVEVDGEAFHRTAGGGRKDDDHWRDLQLESLGWRVCRFWVYELREDLASCVQKVKARTAV